MYRYAMRRKVALQGDDPIDTDDVTNVTIPGTDHVFTLATLQDLITLDQIFHKECFINVTNFTEYYCHGTKILIKCPPSSIYIMLWPDIMAGCHSFCLLFQFSSTRSCHTLRTWRRSIQEWPRLTSQSVICTLNLPAAEISEFLCP